MSSVVLKSLVKRFGPALAVDHVSLEIAEGELFSLLGSSGCGKTTTLRCVAGLELPSAGEILLDGQDVAQVPPHARDCGMVFQNYALFPHMTLAENVAYGLMARRYREGGTLRRLATLFRSVTSALPAEDLRQVREALDMVELGGLEERRPGQLSGGQQQRVALARALVTRPRVLLFDEPLGALDAKLRVKMREEIRRIQRRAGITTLYVTHDQEEALSISDRLAVMNGGRVVQMGSPEELYLRPRSRFLADFIGLTNIFPAASGGAPGRVTLTPAAELGTAHPLPAQGPFAVAVRPEAIRFLEEGEEAENSLTARVAMRMFMGNSVKYVLQHPGGAEWVMVVPQSASTAHRTAEEQVRVGFAARDVLILEDGP